MPRAFSTRCHLALGSLVVVAGSGGVHRLQLSARAWGANCGGARAVARGVWLSSQAAPPRPRPSFPAPHRGRRRARGGGGLLVGRGSRGRPRRFHGRRRHAWGEQQGAAGRFSTIDAHERAPSFGGTCAFGSHTPSSEDRAPALPFARRLRPVCMPHSSSATHCPEARASTRERILA